MNHKRTGYSGSDWLKESWFKAGEMSPLGEAVGDLLGDVFYGIYHLPTSNLRKVDWTNKYWIEFSLMWHDLATVDFDDLTRLVVLAHDRMLRVSIKAAAPRNLCLVFHQRKVREGGYWERCPTIETHVREIHESYYGPQGLRRISAKFRMIMKRLRRWLRNTFRNTRQ